MDKAEVEKKLQGVWKHFGLKEWGLMLLIGICLLVIVFPTKTKDSPQQSATEAGTDEGQQNTEMSYTEELESRLEEILSKVQGVGRVQVMITTSATSQKKVLQDGRTDSEEMTEKDSAGGSRVSVSSTQEKETVFYESEGASVPYVVSEEYPGIVGVLVLAEGSGTGSLDYDILNAVQVLFDIPAHKIKVMKMK